MSNSLNSLNSLWIKDLFRPIEWEHNTDLPARNYFIFGDLQIKVPNLFLHSLKELKTLNRNEFWIARDGFLLALDFFTRFPSPQDLNTKISLHISLNGIIPKAWSENILFYDFLPNPKAQNHQKLVFIKNSKSPHKQKPFDFNKHSKKQPYLLSIQDFFALDYFKDDLEQIKLINGLRGFEHEVKSIKFDQYLQMGRKEPMNFFELNDQFVYSFSTQSFLLADSQLDLLHEPNIDGERLSIHSNIDLILNDQIKASDHLLNDFTKLLKFTKATYTDYENFEYQMSNNFIRSALELWT